MVSELAYAKVNLALEVGELLDDGYHSVRNIMVPIDLYDELTFQIIDKDVVLLDDSNIPYEKNLVYKAAKMFLEAYSIKEGVLITLKKKIPQEAGLAGGSSDAAATLRGLNRLFDLNISLDELASKAIPLGSDVPYCIYNKAAICTGHGTDVKLLKSNYEKCPILLIKPPFGCSTASIYKEYVKTKNNHNKAIENIINGLTENNIDLVIKNMFNDLEEPAFKLNDYLKRLKDTLNLHATNLMSGSGSTLFVLSKDEELLDEISSKMDKFLTVIKTKLL